MRSHVLCGLTCAVLSLAALGCTSPGNYLGNRAADLADVFTAELTIGPGLDVHAQVTGLLGSAFGYSPQWGLMMHGRFVGTGERNTGGIVITGGTRVSGDLLDPVYGDAVYVPRDRAWFPFIRYPALVPAFRRSELARLLDVEAGGAAIVGVHFGVSPIELVDFLLGFAFLDMVGDDYRPTPPAVPVTPATPAPSAGAEPGHARGE